MIAADSSTWIAFWGGIDAPDTQRLRQALADHAVAMVPVVLAELVSAPHLDPTLAFALEALPCLDLLPGHWRRAGELRARLLARNRKARLGDALIAQCCLDHRLPLITRDRDFLAFAQAANLNLLLPYAKPAWL